MHCSCPWAKNLCLMLPSLFYNGLPTGLMLDCSIKSVTIIPEPVIVELVVVFMSTIYVWCFSPWTCPLPSYNIFNTFEIIRQLYFVGNILRVIFHEWLLIHEICENFPLKNPAMWYIANDNIQSGCISFIKCLLNSFNA